MLLYRVYCQLCCSDDDQIGRAAFPARLQPVCRDTVAHSLPRTLESANRVHHATHRRIRISQCAYILIRAT